MAKREQNGADTIRALARAVLAFDAGAVSARAMRQAKLLLLDTIGCALAGAEEHAARAVLEIDRHAGTNGPCPLIGSARKTGMADAAFVNGVLARVLDFNDYLVGEARGEPEAGGHPSDNISVALAAGSARARPGMEILAAIVAGYELYARLQSRIDRAGAWDGVTVSGLVAPAMAGRLMGLDEERMAHALALGAARAATPSLVRRGAVSEAKALANALVAQAGVQAALLAERGVTGPLAILDDTRGLRGIFAAGEAHLLTAPFPSEGAILNAHVKAYPCINTGQSAIAAALALHDAVRDDWRSLARIDIVMADYPAIARHQDDPDRARPQSREAADHSFPFLVAAALMDGAFGHAQFANARWHDPATVALMERITMHRDAGWNARAPGGFPCTVRAFDTAGREHRADVPAPPGFSRGGLDEGAVLAKFQANAAPVLDAAACRRIVDAVMEFDHSPAPTELDAALMKEGKVS